MVVSGRVLDVLRAEMEISGEELRKIALDFQHEMDLGLAKETSSLKMLPSYLGRPEGREKGDFLALDFGGTNVRIMLVNLKGNGAYEVIRRVSFPLRNEKEGYDYTKSCVSCEELFKFIARKIKAIIQDTKAYRLGHTFSFPCTSQGVNHATLIRWTKEFETSGAEGQDIGRLLEKALRGEHLDNVVPSAIINDTVGILLTAAYGEKDCDIGTILGTGHNTCYLERNNRRANCPMIINTEAGNFNRIPQTGYDRRLDEISEKPGEQLLEKMVSGRYLGELLKLIITGLNEQEHIFRCLNLKQVMEKKHLTTGDISEILADDFTGFSRTRHLFRTKIGLTGGTPRDWQVISEVCQLLRNRSAMLAAATYLGILRHIDPQLKNRHIIAVDGSLYEKMPGYASVIKETMKELLNDNYDKVKLRLIKDGSGIGAAIAAAMIEVQ